MLDLFCIIFSCLKKSVSDPYPLSLNLAIFLQVAKYVEQCYVCEVVFQVKEKKAISSYTNVTSDGFFSVCYVHCM
jgi:hypothetical protein